ncbi:MAG: type II methionyl aminopeptidase [Desulfurococcales archaeon]|nr:type II methionyl aminopeptidase [Desulfurococcales archaeon]
MGELTEEVIKKYIEAGRIAKEVREYSDKIVKPGEKALNVCLELEGKIISIGGKLAFPCNISINEVAAHFTPSHNDETRIPPDAVVKIDLGVHIDGYIADTAKTIDLSDKHVLLLEASREALEKAVEKLKPGVKAFEIGLVIEQAIKNYGFKPVRNLTGHSIDRYRIHAGLSIPNYGDRFAVFKMIKGMTVAIEPFATNGKGLTREGRITNIYSLAKTNPRKLDQESREVFDYISQEYKTLPFTPRWLVPIFGETTVQHAMRVLIKTKTLYVYPILVEVGKGLVSQFEHTILLTKDGKIVTTA